MMLDQWDWKTSAPEFVPGKQPIPPASAPPPKHGPPPVPVTFGPVVGAWCPMGPEANGPMVVPSICGTGHVGFWQQGFNGYEMPNGPNRPPAVHESFFGKDSWDKDSWDDPWEEEEDYAERIRAAQLQAKYEMQLRSKEEELRSLQDRLNRKEDETARMQADFERDRQGLLYNLNQLSHAVAEKKVQDRYDGRVDKGGYRSRESRGIAFSERNSPIGAGKEGLKERSKKREEPEKSAVARPARRPGVAVGPPWSGARLEKLVRQTPGAMELRPHHAADGSATWTLKLCLDELNPPLNDEGMQVFCRWLHQTFQLMREQHQIRSMRMVTADVSLAFNQMADDAVGRLLQALQRSQLRLRSLKFRGNCIGSRGLSQICDFIHEAHFNLRDLDLSQNFLDESAGALELLTLFVDHPKYGPKDRPKVEPVKVDLSHNGLHSSKVLKKLGSIPQLSLQSRRSSSGKREWQVFKNGVLLLRLPDFEAQDCEDRPELPSRPPTAATAVIGDRGREASPPEETPEPSSGEKDEADLRGDVKPRKASDRNRGPKELVKKVLRQQNGNSRAPDFRADKLRIEEHPNEDEADEDRPKKVIEDDVPQPKPVVLVAPPKILQRGAVLEG